MEVGINAEIAENAEFVLRYVDKISKRGVIGVTPTELNEITGKIIEFSIKVHRSLGPGMLEWTHEICLLHELVKHGFKVERQKKLPIMYDGVRLDAGYRIDLLVDDSVIVEVKAVERPIRFTKLSCSHT